MKTICTVILLAGWAASQTLAAQNAVDQTGIADSADRPRIGLALSGGGSRGAAHIGVLRFLEEYHVPIDYIAGTSIGAIVGGFYAAGLSVEQIEDVVAGVSWEDAYDDRIPRKDRSFRRKRDDDLFLIKSRPGFSDGELKFPPGILDGQKIDLLFKRHFGARRVPGDFSQLAIPFRAVATDLATGEQVVLKEGSLAEAIRASMSIPVLIAPANTDGRLLVDGGIANNLPVDVVRDMGADIVIAVDVSTPLMPREELDSIISITDQLSILVTRRSTERQIATLGDGDILIVPELDGITSSTFGKTSSIVERGRIAASGHRRRLQELAMNASGYDLKLKARLDSRSGMPVIHAMRIDNQSTVADRLIESYLNVEMGEPLDSDALSRDLSRVYGLELFSSVTYEVIEQGAVNTLVIRAKERSWGPNYLQFGASFADDFGGDNKFSLTVAYTRMPINSRGGEWRTIARFGDQSQIATELHQPLDYAGEYFFHSRISLLERFVNVFDTQGEITSQFQLSGKQGSLFAGREFGTWGALSAGIRRFHGHTQIRIGDPLTPQQKFDGGEFLVRFAWDELDNLFFPLSGTWGSIQYLGSRQSLGSDDSFEQIGLEAGVALPRGRNTLTLKVILNSTKDDDAPIHNLFRLGGFGRLSGYQIDELSGQHSGLLSADYRRRIGRFNLLPMYLGLSLEYGNVWQTRSDFRFDNGLWAGSLYFGLDSFFGPVYLGYGLAEGGKGNAFFYVGQVF
jgi:NTE family protein